MKKLAFLLVMVFIISLFGCASFNPGSIDYKPAAQTPGSICSDSVYLYTEQLNSSRCKYIFDYDLLEERIYPTFISLSNRSSNYVDFSTKDLPDFMHYYEVTDIIEFQPGTRLFFWCLPWGIHLLSGAPFYYGIAWGVFGFVDYNGSNDANNEIYDFYYRVALKDIRLLPGQDIQGVIFRKFEYLQTQNIILTKHNGKILRFNEMKTNEYNPQVIIPKEYK